MRETVIKVNNLSKQYRLGERKGYKTIRESFVNTAKKTLFRIKKGSKSQGSSLQKKTEGKKYSLNFSYRSTKDTIWALRNISFEVKEGDVLGIIGKNGAGKTTLLKILTRITDPTEGRIELKGRVGSLLEVGTGFHPELTGHENIYLYGAILGMDRYEVTRKYDEIVAFAELEKFVETPVKRYSSGMRMRLAFAVAAHLEPEILLIDEVLAVGDIGFQKKCLGKMESVAKRGRTVLFVSHNMAAVNSLCDKVILLNEGQIEKKGISREIISYYKNEIFKITSSDDTEPGLWKSQKNQNWAKAKIKAVEMLDPDTGKRKETLTTGDSVTFRLHYFSEIDLQEASFMFGICTEENIVLIKCNSLRIDGVETPLKKGNHFLDCVFPGFPLAAGNYYIMTGIAHTLVKWFFRSHEFGRITVLPMYNPKSQRALTSDLAYLSIEHHWRT